MDNTLHRPPQYNLWSITRPVSGLMQLQQLPLRGQH